MSTFVSVSNLFSQSVRSQILAFYLRGGKLSKNMLLKQLNLRSFEFLEVCGGIVLVLRMATGGEFFAINVRPVFIYGTHTTPSYAARNSNGLYFSKGN